MRMAHRSSRGFWGMEWIWMGCPLTQIRGRTSRNPHGVWDLAPSEGWPPLSHPPKALMCKNANTSTLKHTQTYKLLYRHTKYRHRQSNSTSSVVSQTNSKFRHNTDFPFTFSLSFLSLWLVYFFKALVPVTVLSLCPSLQACTVHNEEEDDSSQAVSN